MNILLYIIFAPILIGLICLVLPRLASWIALVTALAILVEAALLFRSGNIVSPMLGLRVYIFSSGIFLAAALFAALILLYSQKFMQGRDRQGQYYGFIMLCVGAAAGILFAADYIVLLVFWAIFGFSSFGLMGGGGLRSRWIIGTADILMFLGIGIIWLLTRTTEIGIERLPLNNIFSILAFFFLLAGALAKSGAVPFHGWIIDSAEATPASAMALLPAALNKFLGIYLLIRICTNVFIINPNSIISFLLLVIGSITLLVAVMAGLVQHNLKKLLSFHAVSQTGYMIMGIGTGIPVAMAGALFHMLNDALCKALLFLSGGAVESQTGTDELDRLGGLARFMPLTFGSAMIAALSISGIPPLNGFVSKWMIYQGIIELGKTSPFWIIWLLAAMFGSAFTLASSLKIMHAVFLGQWSESTARAREVSWWMWAPMVIMAALCVLFGIFAFALPLNAFILPSIAGVRYTGFYSPELAALLIIVGLLVGLLIYRLGEVKKITEKPPYIGGELLDEKTIKVSGVDFFDTIKNWGFLRKFYKSG